MAALVNPRALAATLAAISPVTFSFCPLSLNKIFAIGSNIFANVLTSPAFSAIRIIPSQNAIIPIKENEILTAVSHAPSMELETSLRVPLSIPIISEPAISIKNT